MSLSLALAVLLQSEPQAWQKSDERFQKVELCEAFKNGANYTIHHESCSFMGCDRWNYQILTECVGSGAAARASIKNVKDGEVFSQDSLTFDRWQSFRGNFLRQKAQAVASFGNSFSLIGFEELSGGRLKVSYQIHSQSQQLLEEGYWILGSGTTVETVLERHSTRHGLLQETSADILVR